jgi:hypothetical protein
VLRVTLELLPAGPTGQREKIGQVDISNVAEMNDLSHYYLETIKGGRLHTAMLLGHRRADGPWVLVSKALDVLGWGR